MQDWKTAACPQLCTNNYPASWANLFDCPWDSQRGWQRWCGDYLTDPTKICSAQSPNGTFLAYPSGAVQRIASSNATATAPALAAGGGTSGGSETGLKVGLGAALGVGIPLAALLGWFVGRRSAWAGRKGEGVAGGVAPQYYADGQAPVVYQTEMAHG